jgi:hypothetical protein
MVACSEAPTSPTAIRPEVPALSSIPGETPGCTFGAGYWKNHPRAWPRRFDPDATFFTSGKSWIEVLRTAPRGDAYYILGHQFIAAGLNLEQLEPGLRPREIGSPWAITGNGFFTDGAHSSLTRIELLNLAALFESFNEGKRGVPPCS